MEGLINYGACGFSFFVGAFFGAAIMLLVVSLCVVAGRADDKMSSLQKPAVD